MKQTKAAILTTLLYSDIFSYPLTKEELWRYLSYAKSIRYTEFEQNLQLLQDIISAQKGYYFLTGRDDVVVRREKYFRESKRKLKKAERVAPLLSLLPTVLFIGVSGSVAMRNSNRTDDIDLFIITRKNTLWVTRLLTLLLLRGKRRGRDTRAAKDAFCVNMFLDERSLPLARKRRNLYTAHEVVRMVPLFEREGTYIKFLKKNMWVKDYLPNSVVIKKLSNKVIKANDIELLNYSMTQLLSLLEFLAKHLQLWYMKGHRTTEDISDTLLAFHPFDYQSRVLTLLQKRLEQYRLV